MRFSASQRKVRAVLLIQLKRVYTKLDSKQLFSVYNLSQLLNHKHSHQDIANATPKQKFPEQKKTIKKKI